MAIRDAAALLLVGGMAWAVSRYAKMQEDKGPDAAPAVIKNNPAIAGFFGDMVELIAATARADSPTTESVMTRLKGTIVSGPSRPTSSMRGEPPNIGAQLRSDLMQTFGLSRMHAGAIVANLHWESGGFKSLQEIKPLVPGSRGGFGYAQWTGPRRRQFEAWVKARGLDARSYAANWGFLRHELTNTSEKSVLPRLKATRTMRDAVITFCGSSPPAPSRRGFLRPGIPHMEKRVALAQRVYA